MNSAMPVSYVVASILLSEIGATPQKELADHAQMSCE
jgi:hypothetical protein